MTLDVRDAEMAQLSDLIGSIYDCVLDPGRWEATLGMEVRRFLDCANCSLTVFDLRTLAVRMQTVIGMGRYWVAKAGEYGAEMARLYGLLPDFHTRPIDEPISVWRDAGEKAVLASRYYLEWGKPQGLIEASMAIFLMRRPDRVAEFALGRSESVEYHHRPGDPAPAPACASPAPGNDHLRSHRYEMLGGRGP